MKNTVIFDMDGVLLDTEAMIIDCWEEMTDNLHNIRDICYKCVGVTQKKTEEIFIEAYPQFKDSDIFEKFDIFLQKKLNEEGVPSKYYAAQLLEFLKQNGFRLALCSSTILENIKKELSHVGLLEYFEVIVGGDMVKNSKPAPDGYLKTLEILQCNPQDAYVIEDSVNGLLSALSAGITPFMVPDLLQPPEFVIEKNIKVFQNLEHVQHHFEHIIKEQTI